jgi:phage gp46-like protein
MPDISTLWDPERLSADWALEAGGLRSGDDLATAVVLSLFTDRRAAPDDVPPGDPGDRRGWWADAESPEGPLGSRLWLLVREKRTEETRRRAIDYAREALAWLVEDGVAARVDVDAEWQERDRLALAVGVVRPGGGSEFWRFAWAWQRITTE